MNFFWMRDKVELKLIDEDEIEWLGRHLVLRTDMLPWGFLLAEDNPELSILEAAQLIVERNKQEAGQLWFVLFDTDGLAVGYAFAERMNARVGRANLFVYILEEFRGKGYAKECIKILIEYFINEQRYVRIGCELTKGNTAGISLVQDMGFELEGEWRQQVILDNEPMDMLVFSYFGYTDKIKTRYNIRKDRTADFKTDGVDVKRLTYAGVALKSMDEDAYACKHEILYDDASSVTLEGQILLPKNPDWISGWEVSHCDGKIYRGCTEYSIYNEENQLVGTVGFVAIDHKNKTFSYDLYIFRQYMNRGYGTKALFILMTYAFSVLKMNKMYMFINEGNIASERTALRLGCEREGTQHCLEYYHGQHVDAHMYGITMEKFERCFVKKKRELVRYNYIFEGRVQGVGFRYRAKHVADGFGLAGWVRNCYDGTVEMEVQGNPDTVERMITEILEGRYIQIDNTKRREISVQEEERYFHIR